MTRDELIAALESATTPSVDLDTEIAFATGWRMRDAQWKPPGGDWGAPLRSFTGSIDAAVSLVPNGIGRMSGKGRTRDDEPLYGCTLHAKDGRGREIAAAEHDHGEALAICLAALRLPA